MEIVDSRVALDPTLVRDALVGWQGPQPLLLGSVPTLDLLASALVGLDEGACAVAEQVSAGWGAVPPVPAGAALWVSSVVASDGVEPARRGWLSLVAALAAVDALRTAARVPAEVTWPDGLTVPGAMCGGDAGTRALGTVAVERCGDSDVVTVGILVSLGMLELPRATTSVYADGGDIDRAAILGAYLPALAERVRQWRTGDPALALAYRDRCQTLGRLVEIDGAQGRVRGIDDSGALVVDVDGTTRTVRPDEPAPLLA
jgi:BirA family biotin operon repressor/biotin-[acetyl-CoA-carboxylase] ligase